MSHEVYFDTLEKYTNDNFNDWNLSKVEGRMMITLGTKHQDKWIDKYLEMLILQIRKTTCLRIIENR